LKYKTQDWKRTVLIAVIVFFHKRPWRRKRKSRQRWCRDRYL